MNDSQLSVDEQNAAWAEWLWRRGVEPGVVRLAQVQTMAVRLTHMNTPPLADEVSRRYAAVMAMQQQLPPIVYAEPIPAVQNEATSGPKDGSPLPIVTAKVAAGVSNPMPTSPTSDRRSIPVVHSVVTPNQKTAPNTTNDRPKTSLSSVQPGSSTTPESAISPPVTLINNARSQGVPIAKPSVPTKRDAAMSGTDTHAVQPVANDRHERPSPVPVVRAAGLSPLKPKPVQDAAQSHLVQVPNAAAQTEANRPDNGRIPMPVAREQLTVAGPPATPPLPQPLPLAPPVGSVIQRAAQENVNNEKSTNRSASSPQPTPAPNRVVRANPVVQRATGDTGTAVPASGNEENDSSAETTPSISNLDMDELVEKVHRRFLRRLVVEGERRGKTVWP